MKQFLLILEWFTFVAIAPLASYAASSPSIYNIFGHFEIPSAHKCFLDALNASQSCGNRNILYVTTMGGGSGLGSEFNAYLIPSLLTAIAYNMRMVYYRSKRKWEYDCSSHDGWACYLSFRCEEKGVDAKQLDYTQKYLINDESSEKIANMTSLQMITPSDEKLYESIRNRFSNCAVSRETLTPTIMTSMSGRYLFQLNAPTRATIKRLNARFKSIHHVPYLSLQLRMTDKIYEMSPLAWQWISNLTNTVSFMKLYFYAARTNKIFVGKWFVTFLPSCSFLS